MQRREGGGGAIRVAGSCSSIDHPQLAPHRHPLDRREQRARGAAGAGHGGAWPMGSGHRVPGRAAAQLVVGGARPSASPAKPILDNTNYYTSQIKRI
jgi:hypothetical protein